MRQLRVGSVRASLVEQAEHAFHLWEERERFAFVGLADASAAVRTAGAMDADVQGLLKCNLDTIEIANYRPRDKEALREELRAFHAAATGAGPVQMTVERARRDVELLISAFKKAIA